MPKTSKIKFKETELRPSSLPEIKLSGTPRACGRDYGTQSAEALRGFLNMEVPVNRKRLTYARKCWEVLSRWEKPIADFVRGTAAGSGLSEEELTLILLHEEVSRSKRCTAFGATGPGTKDGAPIIGQNWDMGGQLYTWGSLLRMESNATPKLLSYNYPGQWAGSGINEHGVCLVWTSSCCIPNFKSVVGVPTYALIPGILAQSSCRDAIKLLRRTQLAGTFIFLIADGSGEIWCIEAVPGHIQLTQCHDVLGRANHFGDRAICELVGQKVPRSNPKKTNTRAREGRILELLNQFNGEIAPAVAQRVLRDHSHKPGLTICQHATAERKGMTIDSFYYLPKKREMWLARGFACQHEYTRHVV